MSQSCTSEREPQIRLSAVTKIVHQIAKSHFRLQLVVFAGRAVAAEHVLQVALLPVAAAQHLHARGATQLLLNHLHSAPHRTLATLFNHTQCDHPLLSTGRACCSWPTVRLPGQAK